MSCRGEVLVAIMNSRADLDLAREQHWYRIPIEQVEMLKQLGCWAPKWLAFYQTKVFGTEAYAVNYYAKVTRVDEVSRGELFPDRPRDAKSEQRYYKLELSPLEKLSPAIASQSLRRVTFIPTTLAQFKRAKDVSELMQLPD